LNPLGRAAESRAAIFLRAQGLQIIERNWRCRFGEIDLVAREGRTLVFVEVRARSARTHGGAAESISAAKRRRLTATANYYLARCRTEQPCRFDALLIESEGRIEWVRNAFDAS
jgi:putative endonuclease